MTALPIRSGATLTRSASRGKDVEKVLVDVFHKTEQEAETIRMV